MNSSNSRDSVLIKIWQCVLCRIGILGFTFLLALIFLLSVLANPILNWIVKPQIISSTNNDKTQLNISGIDFSLFQNRILGYDTSLSLKDSSANSADTTRISAPLISISGINWITVLFQNGYSIGNITVEKPGLRISNYSSANIRNNKNSDSNNSKNQNSSIAKNLLNSLPKKLNPLKIGSLNINSANVVREIHKEDKTIDTIKNLSVSLLNINVNKNLDYEGKNHSLIGAYEISVKGIHKRMFGPGYDFKIESINISSDKSDLLLKGLNFQPYVSDNEFFRRKQYRSDRWIIKIPEIRSVNSNLIKFFNSNLVAADSLIIPQFDIQIVTNKTLPLNPNSDPKMPHKLMTSLGFNLEVNKFIIRNSNLLLESIMSKVDRRAQLRFRNINAVISNLSNTSEKQTPGNPCKVDAWGLLQGKGKLEVNLSYFLLSNELTFNYSGSMDEMDAVSLNSHLEVEDKASISSGKIIQVKFSSDVNNGIADVNIIPLYTNLSIKILEEDAEDERKIPTWLAGLKVRESNPNDEGKIKSGNVTYVTKPGNVFLDVVWLALLKGLGEVVGF